MVFLFSPASLICGEDRYRHHGSVGNIYNKCQPISAVAITIFFANLCSVIPEFQTYYWIGFSPFIVGFCVVLFTHIVSISFECYIAHDIETSSLIQD